MRIVCIAAQAMKHAPGEVQASLFKIGPSQHEISEKEPHEAWTVSFVS
jgi:hypothetical protein